MPSSSERGFENFRPNNGVSITSSFYSATAIARGAPTRRALAVRIRTTCTTHARTVEVSLFCFVRGKININHGGGGVHIRTFNYYNPEIITLDQGSRTDGDGRLWGARCTRDLYTLCVRTVYVYVHASVATRYYNTCYLGACDRLRKFVTTITCARLKYTRYGTHAHTSARVRIDRLSIDPTSFPIKRNNPV